MTWEQVDQLFHAALEREIEERAAFLDQACDGDEALRREVESLLAADARAETGSEEIPAQVAAEMLMENQTRRLIGRQFGPYRILSALGAGGMGEVYLALDARLGRKIALKLLPLRFTQDPERLERFEREARAASSLNHPNIITIYEIGESEQRHFIAAEFVEGKTLREKMAGGRMDPGVAIEIATQAAGALAAAHNAGIIHRDVKPENVMIRPDGLVKVLDFGLAKLTEERKKERGRDGEREGQSDHPSVPRSLTEGGIVMGTVSYMSPEQARGQKVDHRTDIFSLGVVIYEMLAGRRPFEGKTTSDVIAALLTAEPPPLKEYCVEATTEIKRITEKCLAKDSENRFQSAGELLAELKMLPLGSQAKTSAETLRIGGAGGRFGARRWLAVTAIAAVVIIGFLSFLLWRRTPAVEPNRIKSLAVLPLKNLSADPSQDYLADGLTETLIAGLAKVGALRVSSRTSVMQYQGTRKPLTEIARELNVDAVIEGSVQRAGEQVKITARLIHASTERSLWADAYERDLRDALALQNEIAQAVIQQIQIQLTPQEQIRLASAHPVNPVAYDDYLRGRFYANRENKVDNEISIRMLERAVATDPNFAVAHAELAQEYTNRLFLFTPGEKPLEEKAFVAVEKALSLDPDLASAYLARGRLLWTPANHFPHEKAIQQYRRALALNPSLDEAQTWLALIYNHIGGFDQALQELQKAVTINPTNISAQFRIGQTLLFQGKYEPALSVLRGVPKEGNPRVGYHQAMALLHLGRSSEAAAIAEEFIAEYPDDADGGLLTGFHALLAASAGDEKKAEARIRSAIHKGKGFGHFHHTAYDIACAYSLMKKTEPSIQWLQTTADDGFPCYPLFEHDPFLDNLRKDSRFTSLMTKLKEQWESYRTRL
jgi:serine/threonine protein kinase/cytochrome c-type biogenesis protein CcmH/NrfG